LESQLEKKEQQFKEQEKTMSMLQQDIICKQHHLESLDRLLTESKGEMEKENMKKDEALKTLQNQVSEETIKANFCVRQLDSALEICKEELALHLNQLEGNKEKFEKQLKKKSEEKELKIKNHSLQETTEQNVILQHTLQQQQQMLQQETIRNGELEDIQTKLEKQVSKLEQELQKQRESSAEKLRKMEEKCEAATYEADLKRQKVIELTGTARQVKLEMDHYKEELYKMEKEIKHLKRDGENKAMHLSQLDMILEQTKTELDKKTNAVKELEKLQHHTETELTEALQKREVLETELQNAHGELKSTLRQLQELRDVLQKAQLSLEEKYTTIKDLTAELRLQYFTKRKVTHLDMTIREYRGEMEQKIIKLEGTVEKSELELKESNKQIEALNEKLQNAKEQLREKEFITLQNEQEISQLKKETERTQEKMKEMESVMKEQEQYIATQYKEAIDLEQELRLTREQMQNSHTELVEARRQQVQAQREVERLSSELEEIKQLSKEKESHGKHLAEELGASQVREAQLEARMQAEIKKLSAEVESVKEAYHLEMLVEQLLINEAFQPDGDTFGPILHSLPKTFEKFFSDPYRKTPSPEKCSIYIQCIGSLGNTRVIKIPWNFAFGQASLTDGMGIFSLVRYGGFYSLSYEGKVKKLQRTPSNDYSIFDNYYIPEMTSWLEHLMQSSRDLEKAAQCPLNLYPICLHKLLHAVGCSTVEGYKALMNLLTHLPPKHSHEDNVNLPKPVEAFKEWKEWIIKCLAIFQK
ncbi:hypothetical protein E2I00_003576, partial [Balaenoptera physalus]